MSVNGIPLDQVEKFKYLGVEFSNDARLDCEIDRRIGSASAILRSLYRSVVTKKEVSRGRKWRSLTQSIVLLSSMVTNNG